mgnify:CR=1 FL=1
MYKFFGTPLQEIKGAQSGKVIFRFDHKGEYFTDDEKIIARAVGHFDHVEVEAREIGERAKKTIVTPGIQFSSEDSEQEPAPESKDKPRKLYACEHCGMEFDAPYKLAQHVRKEHSKNKG